MEVMMMMMMLLLLLMSLTVSDCWCSYSCFMPEALWSFRTSASASLAASGVFFLEAFSVRLHREIELIMATHLRGLKSGALVVEK